MTRPFAFTASQRSGGGGSVTPTPSPTPTPTPTPVTNVLHEGDSISNSNPGTVDPSYFPALYAQNNPTLTFNSRAAPSRTVGGAAYAAEGADTGTPTGNTLLDHRTEDLAYAPQLYTVMIGANDFATFATQGYINRLVTLTAPIRAAGVRVIYSPPMPYRAEPAGSRHPSYGGFTARRGALISSYRNPALWSTWCDVILPGMGAHPDWRVAGLASALYGDSVHASGPASTGSTGQNILYVGYAAGVDTLRDRTRDTSTQMYGSAWLAGESGLAPGVRITRRFMVKGIRGDGTALGVSISGAGSPTVQIVTDENGTAGSSAGTDSSNGYRLYLTDVVEVQVTPSSSPSTDGIVSLTVGSETRSLNYKSGAVSSPVTYSHGGFSSQEPGFSGNTVHTYAALAFAAGIPIIGVGGGVPASVTVGGVAATLLASRTDTASASFWAAPAVSAGTPTVVLSYSSGTTVSEITYGSVVGADPTPTQVDAVSSGPGSPYQSSTLSVPTNGLSLSLLGMYGGASAAVGSVTASTGNSLIVAQFGNAFNGEKYGLMLSSRTAASGKGDFQYGVFTNAPLVSLVFKASGT